MELNESALHSHVHVVHCVLPRRAENAPFALFDGPVPGTRGGVWDLATELNFISRVDRQRGTRVTRALNELKRNSASPRGANSCRACPASNIRINSTVYDLIYISAERNLRRNAIKSRAGKIHWNTSRARQSNENSRYVGLKTNNCGISGKLKILQMKKYAVIFIHCILCMYIYNIFFLRVRGNRDSTYCIWMLF